MKCYECRNPVRRNGYRGLCGKCLTTPYEIRQRQIHGCLSLCFIGELPAQRAKARQRAMALAAPETHRKRFYVVLPAPPGAGGAK